MEKTWFIFQSDHHLGPFSTDEIFEMLKNGKIDEEIPLWKEGVENWYPLKDFEEFSPPQEVIPDIKELPDFPDLPEIPVVEDIIEEIELPELPVESDFPDIPDELPDFEDNTIINEEVAIELPDLPPEPVIEEVFPIIEKVSPEIEELLQIEEVAVVSDQIDNKILDIESVDLNFEPIAAEIASEDEASIEDDVWDQIEVKPSVRKINYKLITAVASCFIILVLSGYLIYQSAQSYINLDEFSAITVEKVDEIRKSAFTGNVRAEIFMSKNSKNLILATNIRHKSKIYLTLSSVSNRTFSSDQIVATAVGTGINGVAKFPELKIIKGDKFTSGEYYVQMLAIPVGVEQRARSYFHSKFDLNFLKPIGQLRFRGKSLIFAGTKEDFEISIARYKEKSREEHVKPLKFLLEGYKTFSILSTKVYKTYEDVLTSIRRGKDIESFEILYSKKIGPVLQGLILETHKDFKKYEISDPDMSKKFEILLEQGKRIGEMASDMVTMTKKVKRLRKKNRNRLMKLFIKRSLFLQETSKTKVKEVEKELKNFKL